MIATPRSQPSELVTFDRPRSPLAIFFVVVPALIFAMIVVNFLTHRFPLPLLAMLGAVAATCLFWIKTALDHIGTVEVEMTPQTMSVKRLFGSSKLDWNDIELIKLVDPGASLADGGRAEGSRVGIGIYLRAKSADRMPEAPPDLMLVTAMQESAAAVIKGSERLITFHRKATTGKAALASGFGRTAKPVRRQTKAA